MHQTTKRVKTSDLQHDVGMWRRLSAVRPAHTAAAVRPDRHSSACVCDQKQPSGVAQRQAAHAATAATGAKAPQPLEPMRPLRQPRQDGAVAVPCAWMASSWLTSDHSRECRWLSDCADLVHPSRQHNPRHATQQVAAST